jgi:hypothetical protein
MVALISDNHKNIPISFLDLTMASPAASATKTRSEDNEQYQPSLSSIATKPQSGIGANIVLIGPPGSGNISLLEKVIRT